MATDDIPLPPPSPSCVPSRDSHRRGRGFPVRQHHRREKEVVRVVLWRAPSPPGMGPGARWGLLKASVNAPLPFGGREEARGKGSSSSPKGRSLSFSPSPSCEAKTSWRSHECSSVTTSKESEDHPGPVCCVLEPQPHYVGRCTQVRRPQGGAASAWLDREPQLGFALRRPEVEELQEHQLPLDTA